MSRNKTQTVVALVAALLAGCDGGGQDEGAKEPRRRPTRPRPRSPQTTTASGTSAANVVEDLRANAFKVTGVKEGESFPAQETLDMRIDGVEAGVLTFGSVELAQ